MACAASGAVCDWPDGRQNPDTIVARLDYAGHDVAQRVPVMCRGTLGGPNCEHVVRVVTPEGAVEMRGVTLSPCGSDATERHLADWLRCVHERSRPRAPIEVGYAHAAGVAMVVRAMRAEW